jgi:hypothetical protein
MASESSSPASSGGIGLLGLLGVAFVVLKLCHVISWSWWWVLAPLWGGFLLALIMIAIAVVIAFAAER